MDETGVPTGPETGTGEFPFQRRKSKADSWIRQGHSIAVDTADGLCGSRVSDRFLLRPNTNLPFLAEMMSKRGLDYRTAGVSDVSEDTGLGALAERVRRSFAVTGGPGNLGGVHLDLGHFANVIEIAPDLGLAISTDGVGTKLLIAEMLEKYDTVGIDCIAMNVNDILCVGARPVTMVDYIAVEQVDAATLGAIADGLLRGAEESGISIAGGELAQVAEMIRGVRPGSGFDIVGTAVGVVPLNRIIVGNDLNDGDVVIGLASTGVHSNGFTLARKALFEAAGYAPDEHVPELGRPLGETLLEPTRIYVRPILALLDAVHDVKALAHITGDGLLNLLRIESDVGFQITDLLEPHPVFDLIESAGQVDKGEMFKVFNMGVGFTAVVSAEQADQALAALHGAGAPDARVIGVVDAKRPGLIAIPAHGLQGSKDKGFVSAG
jgi:phosphoribosylformylglycinamidine cyclo-ligase